MTAYRVVVAERKDLEVISIVCDECRSVISLDVTTGAIPPNCASCGKQYGDAIANALAAFGRFQRSAKVAEEHAGKPMFRFEIRQMEA